jgi:AcrR family transcriptional regulator
MARPASDISDRIVHAARDRFLTEGVDGASLRQIAKDAGTSIGMIYYYYPTKDDLFLGVVEEKYAALLEDFEEALAPSKPVEERIRDLFLRIARFSDDEVTLVRIVVREAMLSSERRHRIAERFARGHLPLVLRTIADGVTSGRLRSDLPAPVLGISMFALALFPQILRRLVGDSLPVAMLVPKGEDLARMLADVVLHGITPRK